MQSKEKNSPKTTTNLLVIACFITGVFYSCGSANYGAKDIDNSYFESYLRAYWASDSMGVNGFRDLASQVILLKKENYLGRDTAYLIGLLGLPFDKGEGKKGTNFIYLIVGSPDRNKYAYTAFLSFLVDRDEQKIIKITRYSSEW